MLDVAPGAVDAAVVELPGAPAAPWTQRMLNPYIAPLLPVTVQRPRGSALQTQVVDVNNTFQVFNVATIPIQFSLARYGQPGDSGSLVCDDRGQAIGIYIGKLADLLGRQLGFAQHLFQVSEIMQGMEVLA
jgi:hypothetical protein